MASRKGTVEQVYITQMVQPLVKAITAALTRYRSELAGRTAAV